MYATDLIWILYTVLLVIIGAFMLWFASKVGARGGD